MSNELNQKVVPLQQFEGVSLHKNINISNVKMAEFFTCIGCALEPLPIYGGDKYGKGFGKSKKDETAPDAEGSESEESMTGALVIMAVCIVGAIAMAAYGIFGNLMLKADNVTMQSNVDSLAYAQDTADEYNATKAKYDWITKLDNATVSENNNLVSFIKELEQKMPSQIKVISLAASETGLTLSIDVDKKAAVADIISQLRTFDSIEVYSVSEITEETDKETGKVTVNFTVECNYISALENTENAEGTNGTDSANGTNAGAAPKNTENTQSTEKPGEAATESTSEAATEQ